MAVVRGIVVVVACGVVFAGGGGLIAVVLNWLAPGYYQGVLQHPGRGGGPPGVGTGVLQGLPLGLFVGTVVACGLELFGQLRWAVCGRALAILAACAAVFAVGGGLVGLALGVYAPDYYRSVVRGGQEPDFSPIDVGVGLGTSQGAIVGVIVGALVVVALAWRRSRAEATRDAPGRLKPFHATLVFCLLGGTAVALLQSLDKQGRLNLRASGGHILVLESPFIAVAAAAWWWRPHRWLPYVTLGVAAACLALGLWGNLTDYISWSRTPPGRDVMHFGAFVVMLWSWLLCLGLLVTGLASWAVRRWARGRAEPLAAQDTGRG